MDGTTWLSLEFCDDGIGLAPAVREHMFEPFFTTKRGQGGSGLGMHIVHTIVQQLGGQVRAIDGASRLPHPYQAAAGSLKLSLNRPYLAAAIASATASATLMPSTAADRMPPA